MSSFEERNCLKQNLQDERMNMIKSQCHNPENQEILKITVQTNRQMAQSTSLDADIQKNLKLLGYE